MRRLFVTILLVCGLAGPVAAQTYPSRPVRIVAPFPPGGPLDVHTRIIAQKFSEAWGQQVLVENRPGANTIVGAEAVARATPDGYTLLMAIDSTLVMNPYLYEKLPYDPFKDFAPITQGVRGTTVLTVHAASNIHTVADLVREAKANPGKLTYGSGTITTQLAGELLKSLVGIDVVHVPYRGSAPTVQALLTREVTYTVDGLAPLIPHIQAGTLRLLATTGGSKIPAFPDTPTLAQEANLPGFDMATWQGLLAPAGTPAPILAKLYADAVRLYNAPNTVEKLASSGQTVRTSASPQAFADYIRSEAERWSKVIKQTGVRGD